MFQKTAKAATNAGNSPENVPKNSQNNNKRRRKFSRKCSIITQIQQQTPGIFREMFHNYAKALTRVTRSLRNSRWKSPRTSNLSEFPLRIAFARYALSASAGRRAEPKATDKPSEEEKSKNLCDKTRLLTISTQSLGDFSTKTKRGLMEQHS